MKEIDLHGPQPWARPCAGLPKRLGPEPGPQGALSPQERQIYRPVTVVWTMARTEPGSPWTRVLFRVYTIHTAMKHSDLLHNCTQKLRLEVQVLGEQKAGPHLPGVKEGF